MDGPPGPDGVPTKVEYRVWNPFRSKLAAAILGGAFCVVVLCCGIWMNDPDGDRKARWGPNNPNKPCTTINQNRKTAGVDHIWMGPGAKVLYLGAASGTTVSHVADIVGA